MEVVIMIRRNVKKVTAVVLAAVCMFSVVGCGNKSGGQSGIGKYQGGNFDAKKICDGVTLTIAVPETTRISDWNENEMTKYIEEKLGVDLEFEVYAAASFNTKINTMVMSGDDLPDMIMGTNLGSLVQTWGQAGALVELTDYYEDKNFAANIQAAGKGAGYSIADYMKDGDGNIYGLPAMEQSDVASTWQRLWIYEPWVKALGAKMPETIDEYASLCKQVAARDMNGNGNAKDEIPLVGCGFNANLGWGEWFEPLMNAFTYAYDPSFWVLEDGTLSAAYATEEWKNGLIYIKENFFDTGLLGDQVYTNTFDNVKASLFGNEVKVFSFVGWQYEGADYNACVGYKAIDGLTDKNGNNGDSMYMSVRPEARGCITTDCANPEAAFLVYDLMCSEYLSITTRYGQEGEDWFLVDDNTDLEGYIGTEGKKMEWISENYSLEFWSSTEATEKSFLKTGPYLLTQAMHDSYGIKFDTSTDIGKLKYDAFLINNESVQTALENRRKEVFDYAPLTHEERDNVSDKKSTLLDYVEEMTAAFLTGRKDINAEWENYLNELDSIGLEEVLDVYQEAYSRVH